MLDAYFNIDAQSNGVAIPAKQERKTKNGTNVNNPGLPGISLDREEPAGAHARPRPLTSTVIEVCRRASSNDEARYWSGRARRVGGARLSSPDREQRREKPKSFSRKTAEKHGEPCEHVPASESLSPHAASQLN
ncbi:hypothetical protein SRHO_G00225470 [Serrasalmus rhombeus]